MQGSDCEREEVGAGRENQEQEHTNTNESRLKMANRRERKVCCLSSEMDAIQQGRVCCRGRYQDKHVDLALYTSMRALNSQSQSARAAAHICVCHAHLFVLRFWCVFSVRFPLLVKIIPTLHISMEWAWAWAGVCFQQNCFSLALLFALEHIESRYKAHNLAIHTYYQAREKKA